MELTILRSDVASGPRRKSLLAITNARLKAPEILQPHELHLIADCGYACLQFSRGRIVFDHLVDGSRARHPHFVTVAPFVQPERRLGELLTIDLIDHQQSRPRT